MNTILILTGRYLPGFKDGGPVRSILNLTQWLGEDYDIRIMCLDRDHGDTKAYDNIVINAYNTVGNAKVYYTDAFTSEQIEENAKKADLVYCCGPYNDYARIAMKLKKAGKIAVPLVIASMGSFSPQAFKIKGTKKRVFVTLMKILGYFKNVTWSVTSERERVELQNILGNGQKCVIASDLARKDTTDHIAVKEKDKLRIIFLSRISRKKNLIVVPDILTKISQNVDIILDVYGIAEDEEYLNECLDKFRKLDIKAKWEYKGEIDSEGVPAIFADYDAFLFPTLGENYGHVIAEALGAGCVPVISDTTPWLDFKENNCGYVCSLDNLNEFAEAITELAKMDSEEYKVIIDNCYKYIEEKKRLEANNSGYRKIFDKNF